MPDERITWVPIRHHSPQCSFQLQRYFKQCKPDVVLIEGPSEANALLPFLHDSQCKPPIAFYVYGVDKDKRYRCFVPFADMSPEWQALKLAKQQGIESHFIDLPYAQQIVLNDQRELQAQGTETLLYSDRLLAGSDPINGLVKQAGCANFDQWWDRFFESGVEYSTPKAYFDNIMQFCLILRLQDQQNGSIDAQTRAREAFMAAQIRLHLDQGKQCLVVTGGYHCYGIQQQLKQPLKKQKGSPGKAKIEIESAVHLVPYSLQRLNSTHDYAAGIPDCGYYAQVWQRLARTEGAASACYQQTNVYWLTTLAKQCQQAGYIVSTADAIEANVLGQRLAALRHINTGRSEMREALLSCYWKQAVGSAEREFTTLVDQQLAGEQVGSLPSSLPTPPLVVDFQTCCRRWSLPMIGIVSEKNLDIYRRQRHRLISRFLHQLVYLDVPYATFVAGPRFSSGIDLQRVREIWQLEWFVETEPHLTECSHWGQQVADAALNKLLKALDDPLIRGQTQVSLLIEAFSMGLHQVITPIIQRLQDWLRQENQPAILCHVLCTLAVAHIGQRALGTAQVVQLSALIEQCYERFCARLPWLAMLSAEVVEDTCDALAEFFAVVIDPAFTVNTDIFYDALTSLNCEPLAMKLQGLVTGILFSVGRLPIQDLKRTQAHVFGATSLDPAQIGAFFQGLLSITGGRFLQEPLLLNSINEQLALWDEETFLTALPPLRLAFTHLSPREASDLWQTLFPQASHWSEQTLRRRWSSETLSAAQQLRAHVAESANRWGITA